MAIFYLEDLFFNWLLGNILLELLENSYNNVSNGEMVNRFRLCIVLKCFKGHVTLYLDVEILNCCTNIYSDIENKKFQQ